MDSDFKEFTTEDVSAALAGDDLALTDEQRTTLAQVLPQIVAKVRVEAEAKKAKELQKLVTALQEENTKALESKVEEIRKVLTPPTPEELTTMLNQEYAEFAIKLRDKSGIREFVIRELPLAVEQKVLRVIQQTLRTRLTEIGQLDWQAGSSSMVDRLEKLLQVAPGLLDTVCECCAVCLDPFNEQPDIDKEWVQKNVGSQRLLGIIRAQLEAGRYRDFLSHVSRFTN